MSRHYLTEDQVWVIVNAPGVSHEQLARAMGVSVSAVKTRRQRLARRPWSCGIAFVRCPICGETVTRRNRSFQHTYHPDCRIEAERRQEARRQDETLDKLHAWQREIQVASLATAHRNRALWSEKDDAYLLDHWDDGYAALAAELARTVQAINRRRTILRHRGLAPD